MTTPDQPTHATGTEGTPNWQPDGTPSTSQRAADTEHFQAWFDSGTNKNAMPVPRYVWNAACAYARRTANVALHARALAAEARADAAEKKQPINTSLRLFDLVRNQRSELHQQDLITEEEYAWLSGGSSMANDPKGGSPSPRRLEEYDDVRTVQRAATARLIEREAELTALRDRAAKLEAELAGYRGQNSGIVGVPQTKPQ